MEQEAAQKQIGQLPKKDSFKKILLIILGTFLVFAAIGAAFFVGYIRGMDTAKSLQVDPLNMYVTKPSPTQVLIKESTLEDTSVPGQKRYTSYKLGISFLYMSSHDNDQVGVKEVGDTVYVYPMTLNLDYTKGQYVKVFTKISSETLSQAIKKQFLSSFSDSCYVKSPANRIATAYPGSYQTASVWYKNTDGTDAVIGPGEELAVVKTDCDLNLMPVGGIVYFLEDTAHPTVFVLFSIGQYGINADDKRSWQDTIEFL